MNEKLLELNFNKLLKIRNFSKTYSFEQYLENDKKHELEGYCIDCEIKGTCHAKNNDQFQLKHISHAAHSKDFIQSVRNTDMDIRGWNPSPIMFIFESPSIDYGFYKTMEYNGFVKKPTEEWYWVHKENSYATYPDSFKGKEYGNLIQSIMTTFRLKNAYITNLVKCGLNDSHGNFLNIHHFQHATINNCLENFLLKEIEALQPRMIFTFGATVTNWVHDHCKEQAPIKGLPHPARRLFKREYFETLYFWLIAKALYKAEIISKNELLQLTITFNEA